MSTLRQEAVVISGKKLARQIREEARADVEKWVSAGHRRPHLSVVLVGDNPASHSYVLNKTRAAADVGKRKLPQSSCACVNTLVLHYTVTTKEQMLALVFKLFSHFNLPQESLVRQFSNIQTSARRSCWTWSTNSTQTIVWMACWSSCLCQVQRNWSSGIKTLTKSIKNHASTEGLLCAVNL